MNNLSYNTLIANGRIPGLDGMRAVSVLLVMLSHFGFKNQIPGALGVTTFFFISGFLITILLLREFKKTKKIAITDFFIRRQIRLLPELLYYIVLSGFIAALYFGLPKLHDYLTAIFYTSNYFHLFAPSILGITDFRWPHLWSLAVEQHFYLTFPLIFAALIVKPKRLLIALTGLCIAVLIWRITIISSGGSPRYTYEASDARMDSIAYGCITALILWFELGNKAFNVDRWFYPLLATGALFLAASVAIRSPFFRETFRYSLQGLAFMLIFLGLYGSNKARFLITLLEVKPLVWMGNMAYGAYLWHFDFLVFVQSFHLDSSFETRPIYTIVSASALIGCTFMMAYTSYRFETHPYLLLHSE